MQPIIIFLYEILLTYVSNDFITSIPTRFCLTDSIKLRKILYSDFFGLTIVSPYFENTFGKIPD